jgi:hypothetical protein
MKNVIYWDVAPLNLVEHRCTASMFRANLCKASTSSYSQMMSILFGKSRFQPTPEKLNFCTGPLIFDLQAKNLWPVRVFSRSDQLKQKEIFIWELLLVSCYWTWQLKAAYDVRTGFPLGILTSHSPLSLHDETWTGFPRKPYRRTDNSRPVSTVSTWEWVYATNLSRLQRETSKRHVGEAHSVVITAILLPQRLSCYWRQKGPYLWDLS